MQLVDFRRQLHYRGIFIIFLIWRLFMNNTQKALINQDVCEQTTPNLGITQSSGLDHHMICSRCIPAATTGASFVNRYKNCSPHTQNAAPSTAAIKNE